MKQQCYQQLEPGLNYLGRALGHSFFKFSDDEPIDESADAEIESELRVTEAIDRKTPIRPKRLKSLTDYLKAQDVIADELNAQDAEPMTRWAPSKSKACTAQPLTQEMIDEAMERP